MKPKNAMETSSRDARGHDGQEGCLTALATAQSILVGHYGAAAAPACHDIERMVRQRALEKPFGSRAELAYFVAALLENRRAALVEARRAGHATPFGEAPGTDLDEVRLINQLRFLEEYSKCLGFYHPPLGTSRPEYLRTWSERG